MSLYFSIRSSYFSLFTISPPSIFFCYHIFTFSPNLWCTLNFRDLTYYTGERQRHWREKDENRKLTMRMQRHNDTRAQNEYLDVGSSQEWTGAQVWLWSATESKMSWLMFAPLAQFIATSKVTLVWVHLLPKLLEYNFTRLEKKGSQKLQQHRICRPH